jgi:hypothetical protein
MAEPDLERDPRGPSERDATDPSPKTRNRNDMQRGSDEGARSKTPNAKPPETKRIDSD